MSNFKDKNIKYSTFCQNVLKKSAIIHGTLDAKHNEIMKDFEKKKENLPKLKIKLEKKMNEFKKIDNEEYNNKQKIMYQNEINNLEKNILKNSNKPKKSKNNQIANIIISETSCKNKQNKKNEEYINLINIYNDELNKLDNIFEKNKTKNELNDKINELKEEISNIENNEDELNYFNDTADILFKYYDEDNIKNNKKIEPMEDLNDFFIRIKDLKNNNDNNNDDKYNLFNKYMKITKNTELKKEIISQIKICSNCKIEKTLHLQDGFLICTNCGESEYILIDSDKPNYKDPLIENKTNGYKRINHFSELLNQCQGKESTDIPDEIFEKIIKKLNEMKIKDLSKLDNKVMRNILKSLNLNSFYEHIPYIINKLNGIPPPTMSRELEEKVRTMFKEVQEPWINFKGSIRKNFLNNNYVFHKIFELLEEDDFIIYFPYLKSREKLQEHDEIWKKICHHNKWEFILSL